MDLDCEVCGKNNVVAVVLIEGAKLNACSACARMGKKVYDLTDTVSGKQPIRHTAPIETEEIVENYGQIIKKRRESSGLSLKDLAHKINETEGFLDHIEKEKMRPTVALARKLEKELKMKLIEKSIETGPSFISNPNFKEPTLGDILEAQKRQKKK